MSREAVYEFIATVDSDPSLAGALRDVKGIAAILELAAQHGFAFTASELDPVLALLRFLDAARRDHALGALLAQASDPAAVFALARQHGYVFSSHVLAHLHVTPRSEPLDAHELEQVGGGSTKIDLPKFTAKIATEVPRQSNHTDFGSALAGGLKGSSSPGASIVAAAAPPQPA